MALVSAGFPGEVTDVEFAQLMSLVGNDGTVGMSVTPSGVERTVTISTGMSNISGVLAVNTAEDTVQLPPNNASSNRVDRVVVRAVWSTETLEFGYVEGTPSSNPQPPSLTREPGDHYEVTLARVRVTPGQGGFSDGDVTREVVPPAAGFYSVDSIAKVPDPGDGALVFYQPGNRLMVGKDGSYHDLASVRTTLTEMPNKPPNWGNSSGYYTKSGVVFIRFNMVRQGNGFDNESVILGTMPSGARPASNWYGNVTNQSTGESYIIEVDVNGRITMPNASFNNGHRLRGGLSYPVE